MHLKPVYSRSLSSIARQSLAVPQVSCVATLCGAPSSHRPRKESGCLLMNSTCQNPRPWARQSCSSSREPTAVVTEDALVINGKRYRRNVGICVVNRSGLVFAAQREDSTCDTWQFPQGGIDDGESPEVAALRELQEETCISPKSVRIVNQIDRWLTYDFTTQVRKRLHGGWDIYAGQAQKWFLVLFDGPDSEINLDTDHKEFKAWQWMELEQLPESVVEFKRDVYKEVAAAFVPTIVKLRESGEIA